MQLNPSEIKSKNILISPLDWGMGHTTRCVVIIRQLLGQNNTVFFAGNEIQIDFMKREFPKLEFIFLAGYNVQFNSNKSSYLQIINQLFKIKSAISDENKVVKKLVEAYKIDVIISDNRYGLFTSSTKNILVTHQLALQIPYLKNWVNAQLQKWIDKFDICWIPDNKQNSLCGNLVQAELKIPKLYIGLLSRFSKMNEKHQFKYLGIVTGPEPERTIFGTKLEKFLQEKNEPAVLVGYKGHLSGIDYVLNPTTDQLEKLIDQSEMVISKAGYTTIMELVHLQKPGILIPTPGQFEQEYLATNIHVNHLQFIPESNFFS